MDIVAMVSYIYYGKSVVQVLSPRGKVWVWDLGLNMPSRYSGRACIIKSLCLIMHGVHYLTMGFNNALVIMHACIFNFRQIWQ